MASMSNKANLGSDIIDFSLKGTDDKNYSPQNFSDKEILIIMFICNHCPYVKAVIRRLVTLQEKYKDKKVQLIGINPNDSSAYPEDSFENMKLFAGKYKINFPYLIDETQKTAKEYDARCTPDIYVFDRERKLRYRGQIDDNWKDESKVVNKDLENAIDLLLQGKKIEFEQIPTIGCSIKWKG